MKTTTKKLFICLIITALFVTISTISCGSKKNGASATAESGASSSATKQSLTYRIVFPSTEKKVIDDIGAWNHPVKKFLVAAPYSLSRLELYDKSTYPVFFVGYPKNPRQCDSSVISLIDSVAKANFFNDFEFVNLADSLQIKVACDKKMRRVERIVVNGKERYRAETADQTISIDEYLETYLQYLKANDTLRGSTVKSFFREDLDKDGWPEAVVAVGDTGAKSPITGLFVLRDRNGELSQVGENLASGQGYWGYKIELVRLKGMPGKYIHFPLTNGVSMNGFCLLGVRGDSVETLAYSASATGVGDDELEDADNDGAYDGYRVNRPAPSYLHYPITVHYTLSNGAFDEGEATLADDLPDYPDSIKGVIEQYLCLKAISSNYNFQQSSLPERLNALFPEWESCTLTDYLIQEYAFGMSMTEQSVTISVDTDKTGATVRIGKTDAAAGDPKLLCRLSKSNGRWRIESIESRVGGR
jgi:hypothetical protein